MKKDVKKPTQILEQLYRRSVEVKFTLPTKQTGLNNAGTKYYFNDCVLMAKKPNNYCYSKRFIPVEIRGFSQDNGFS